MPHGTTDTASVDASEAFGVHLVLELYECDEALLRDNERLSTGIRAAVRDAGATVVESLFHAFSPNGLSGVIVIAESHVTLHTWPDKGYAAIDAFTCGDHALPRRIGERLIAFFGAKRHEETYIFRGLPSPSA